MTTICFPIFDNMEVLDFSGPFDVFSMSVVAAGTDFKLITASPDGQMVTALHGLKIVPDHGLRDCPIDRDTVVVVPGGAIAVINAIDNGEFAPVQPPCEQQPPMTQDAWDKLVSDCAAIVKWLREDAKGAGIIATVCVGAFFGARAGLFSGLHATTHHGLIDRLRSWTAPQGTVVDAGQRFVLNPEPAGDTPRVMSTAGVSAGIDFAFHLLEVLRGADVRQKTQNLMEYNLITGWSADPQVR